MKGDVNWLTKNLAQAVGWDEHSAEGVAEAIAAAGSRQEVDELAQDYLGGTGKVQSIITQFLGETKSAAGSASMSGKASSRGYVELRGGSTHQGTASSRPAGSMTIIHKADKRKGAAPARAAAPEMDRTAANCLCCGKVYDCRESSSNDVRVFVAAPEMDRTVANCLRCGNMYDCQEIFSNDVKVFVDMGGLCTFCGAKVSLSKSGASEVRQSAVERLKKSKAGKMAASSSGQGPSSSAESDSTAIAEARAFKDRLVDYDRNAAKRTNVIDDQSDFFEIDSNAWLSDEERAQLKEQERIKQELELAKKRSVRVTIDLLGRQVIMADHGAEASAMSTENSQLAASAASAAAAEIPQGGGSCVRAALAAADFRSMQSASPAVRIQANPFLKGAAPKFTLRNAAGKEAMSESEAGALPAPKETARDRSVKIGRLQHDDPFSLDSL